MRTPLLRRAARKTRGVALLLVLVILLLVATLATEIALTARTHHKLAIHAMDEFLLRSVIEGSRNILVSALRHDASLQDNIDKEDDTWSWRSLGEFGARDGWGDAGGTAPADRGSSDADAANAYGNRDSKLKFLRWVEDERSKINLLGLRWEKDTPTHINTREALVRLIDRYREQWQELDLTESDAREMVEDLIDWLHDKEDVDLKPIPATKNRQGRLLSLEDLFRTEGGKWTPELCYDVRDPRQTDEEDFSRRTTVQPEPDSDASGGDSSESGWGWTNGTCVPGLFRYLTVWGEGTTGNQPKINVNTAPLPVLEALFEPGEEDRAKSIVEHRRQGGDSSSSESSSADTGAGWFKAKADLTKVEEMGDDLTRYPRLDFFAETKTTTFSLRIVATITSGQYGGDEEDEEDEPKDITADYQYREVVQRTQQGTVSIHAERRHDPLFGESR